MSSPPSPKMVVLSGTAVEDVVAADRARGRRAGRRRCRRRRTCRRRARRRRQIQSSPVAAEDPFGAHRAVDDDVVARTAEVLDAVVAADHEVVAVAADGECRRRSRARCSTRRCRARPSSDVVAVAAEEDVVAVAAEQRDRSLRSRRCGRCRRCRRSVSSPMSALHPVVAGPPLNIDVLAACGADRRRACVPSGRASSSCVPSPRSIAAPVPVSRGPLSKIEVGGVEDDVHRRRRRRYAARDQLGEASCLRAGTAGSRPSSALQVVEAVAVLQVLELLARTRS